MSENKVVDYIYDNDLASIEINSVDAQYILDNCYYGYQRQIRPQCVSPLVREMKQGKWHTGSSVLKFGRIGGKLYLLDGQHRLSAVIEYGKPITFLFAVTSFFSEVQISRAYDTIDNNLANRKMKDSSLFAVLQKETGISRSFLANCSKAIEVMYHGFTRFSEKRSMETFVNYVKDWDYEIELLYELYKESTIRGRVKNKAVIAFALLTIKYKEDKAIEFWESVFTGEMLYKNDPKKRLYDHIISKGLRDMERGRADWIQYALYINAAWKAYLNKSEYKRTLTVTNIHQRDLIVNGTPYNTSIQGNGINSIAIRRGEAYIGKLRSI